MNALFEIVADALKKYAAEILATVLFSVSLWKFPKLRRWLTKYKGEQFPQSRQAEAPKNVEVVSESSPYYERARKCERSAERWRRMSELLSKLFWSEVFLQTVIIVFPAVFIILMILTQHIWIFVKCFIYIECFWWLICLFHVNFERYMYSRIDKAREKAQTLYEQGAEHGEPEAMKRTAQLYSEQKKYLKAAYWYEKLAERGDFEAMYSLVDVYSSALDYENSYLWYQVIKLFGKEKEYTYYYEGSSPVRYVPEYQRKQLDLKAQEIFSKIKERTLCSK